jgi:hypothetical protein
MKPCAALGWSETGRVDRVVVGRHAALDKGIARRVKQAVEWFAETGAGSVKKLQGIDPPAYRLRVGDFASVSNWKARPFAFSVCGTAAKPTAEAVLNGR